MRSKWISRTALVLYLVTVAAFGAPPPFAEPKPPKKPFVVSLGYYDANGTFFGIAYPGIAVVQVGNYQVALPALLNVTFTSADYSSAEVRATPYIYWEFAGCSGRAIGHPDLPGFYGVEYAGMLSRDPHTLKRTLYVARWSLMTNAGSQYQARSDVLGNCENGTPGSGPNWATFLTTDYAEASFSLDDRFEFDSDFEGYGPLYVRSRQSK